MKRILTAAAVTACAIMIASCGGGGGSDKPAPPVNYTIGGTVAGLTSGGLVLSVNGTSLSVASGATSFTAAGSFPAGTAYTVTIQTQPSTPNQVCTITQGNGSIATNVTNVTVSCLSATSFSGVAAVGSPLVGTVWVKDSTGATRTTTLGSNGSYAVDVAGMTAPFVFRAEGTANGHSYTVHSAAVAADIGGTINITQLTDLVVDNIAGQLASTYYDNGNFSGLTPTALNAEAAALKARLLPVLTALGVESGVDLLRTRFTPLASALDSALDVLRVSVDTTTNIATISNIVTQQSIQDAINVAAAAESNSPQLNNTSNIGTAVSDSTAIRTAVTNFTAMFATALPSVANIEARLTPNYLNGDTDRATQAAALAAALDFVGKRFTDIDIKYMDYSALPQVTAIVDFTVRDRNGLDEDRVRNFHILKGTDGVWRLHGDQRVMSADARVHLYRSNNGACTMTGIEFEIEDENPANNGASIDHIMVFGPGLPFAGLRFAPSPGGGDWVYTNVPAQPNSTYYRMASNCMSGLTTTDTVIAAIPDNAAYGFVPFSSTDNSVRANFPTGANAGRYWANIDRRPLTLAEAVASTQFPVIASPTASAFATYVSGTLSISASGLAPNAYANVILERNTAGGNFRSADAELVTSGTGTVSTSLSLTAPAAGDAITSRSLRVASKDSWRRTFMSGHDTN